MLAQLTLHLGFPNRSVEGNQDCFLAPLPGRKKQHSQGSLTSNLFTLFLFCLVSFVWFASSFQKHIVPFILLDANLFTLFLFCLVSFVWFASSFQKHKKISSFYLARWLPLRTLSCVTLLVPTTIILSAHLLLHLLLRQLL